MGLGVLEDRKLKHVPGTATVLDDDSAAQLSVPGTVSTSDLKHDYSGPIPIILVPQPSDDPNDPLNWPLWRRDLILIILSVLSVIATALSPILSANTIALSIHFSRSFTDIALLTGWHLLGIAIAGILCVPSARIWGKRHLYLLGNIILVFSSVWAGLSGRNYTSLLWARIFQGIGNAPFEALVNASVGDLYHVHQRGKRMALSNVALFGGAFMTPVIVGKMSNEIGWEWPFFCVAIFSGVFLPIVFFFVPETTYRRDARLNTDTAVNYASSSDEHSGLQGKDSNAARSDERISDKSYVAENGVDNGSQDPALTGPHSQPSPFANNNSSHLPQRTPFRRQLLPFNGRKTDESFWALFFRPFPLFFHPGIAWACLIQGTLIGWTVFIGIVLATVFFGPPEYFSEVETGYLYAGAFIGAILGFVLAGLISDPSTRWLTRRNRGVYEPEFRLFLVIPQLILGCAGLYGFGITSSDIYRYGWFWPDFFFALEVAGMVLGAVAAALYIVDAHRDIAIEAFTCLLVFKNCFSFALSWEGIDWLINIDGGIKRLFIYVGSAQAGICLLTVFMYIFGKRNRSFFARHDILAILRLR